MVKLVEKSKQRVEAKAKGSMGGDLGYQHKSKSESVSKTDESSLSENNKT